MSNPVLKRLDELLNEFAIERERSAMEGGMYAKEYQRAAAETRAQIMDLVAKALTPTVSEISK